jgi:hypothetical protein
MSTNIKFKVVSKAPAKLKKGEVVIEAPTFLAEIEANKLKKPKFNHTAVNHLRYITDSIAMNYDPQGMSAWSVKPHLFEGRQYNSDEELSAIVIEMLKLCCPKVFGKYVEKQLATLPSDTTMIYMIETDVPESVIPLLERCTKAEENNTVQKEDETQ